MPPIHELARQVVEEILRELPNGVAQLNVVPDQESIEPGHDVNGYHAEISPSNPRAAQIVVHAPRDSWDAHVGFGDGSDCEVWYKNGTDPDRLFKEDLRTILKTLMTSHWQETIVLVNNKLVSCLTSLPQPLGHWRSSVGLTGWSAAFLPWPGKTHKINKWEPYITEATGARN